MKKNELETANIFRKIAEAMIWSLLTVISLLTFIVEIRPFLNSLLGIYFVGLFDGIFVTIIALTIIFYLASRNSEK